MFSAVAVRTRDLTRRLGLAGFGQWWAQELWSFVPASAKASFERRRTRPVLAFDGNVATLWRPQVNGRLQLVEAAKIALDGSEASVAAAGRAALAQVVPRGSPAAEVIVALPARAVLKKALVLPAAIEDDLRHALAYDIDRHTPFKADEVYFDAAVVDRDASRNTIAVDLVAVRRALVDPVLLHAENFGASVRAVVADPPERAAASRVNLLPDDRRVAAPAWARWQAVVAALMVVLAGAALVLPLWQKREEAIALIKVSEGARRRAEASEALRTELERKVSDYNFALLRKYAYPGTVQVLDDVTRILPDDTWLTQLEFHTGRGKEATRDIVLRGESANAGRLVALLQDSKLFTQAAPRSPTTKIQPGPGEIFDVGAQVVPSRAPAAKPLDVTAQAPAPARARSEPTPASRGSGARAQGGGAVTPATQGAPAPAAAAQPATQPVPGKGGPGQPAGAGTPTPTTLAPTVPPEAQVPPVAAPASQAVPQAGQPAAQTGQPSAQTAEPAAQAPQGVPAQAAPSPARQPAARPQPQPSPQPQPPPSPQAQPQFGPLPPNGGGNSPPEGH
ncbi:MAG TPA: pilus assembly protein PilM [Casimicrobiaceae bacterium]|nr:pilus assembly protein PilM [Casimicrobiaceae bacterium]